MFGACSDAHRAMFVLRHHQGGVYGQAEESKRHSADCSPRMFMNCDLIYNAPHAGILLQSNSELHRRNMSSPTNDDLQNQINELRERVGLIEIAAEGFRSALQFLERAINHTSERMTIKHADHDTRIENLENVRINFFIGMMVLLLLNLGAVVFLIYWVTK